jgi:hypothetical protein
MITLNYSPEGYTGAHVEMRVPDNSMTVNEVLDYIQRFLIAAGYVFDEGERIQLVKSETDAGYSGFSGDILTFNAYREDLISLD